MAYTKQQIKAISINSPLTGFVSAPGTIIPADTVLESIEKLDGSLAVAQVAIGTIQVGNNLFNYYNFK